GGRRRTEPDRRPGRASTWWGRRSGPGTSRTRPGRLRPRRRRSETGRPPGPQGPFNYVATTSTRPTRSRQHGEGGLGDLHVLAVVAAAHPDAADHCSVDLDRVSAAEHNQTIDGRGRAGGERRVVLDEVVPGM